MAGLWIKIDYSVCNKGRAAGERIYFETEEVECHSAVLLVLDPPRAS
jgi:hypothetical protein